MKGKIELEWVDWLYLAGKQLFSKSTVIVNKAQRVRS